MSSNQIIVLNRPDPDESHLDLIKDLPGCQLRYANGESLQPGQRWIWHVRHPREKGAYSRMGNELFQPLLKNQTAISDLHSNVGRIIIDDRREGYISRPEIDQLLACTAQLGIPSDSMIYASGNTDICEMLIHEGYGLRGIHLRHFELLASDDAKNENPDAAILSKPFTRFLCFNRRLQHREHRMQFIGQLYAHDLMRYFSLSMGHADEDGDPVTWSADLSEPTSWNTQAHMRSLIGQWPMQLDTQKWDTNLAWHHQSCDVAQLYLSSGISIVTETLFYEPGIFTSEKTWHPIRMNHPFIILGNARTLRYLRQLGYETWSEFWDESYDEILDHHARLAAVVSLISDLATWDEDRWSSFRQASRNICERNRAHLLALHDRLDYGTAFAALW